MNTSLYNKNPHLAELWEQQLMILDYFDSICKEYKLTYWANGGTLLGAVRNKGFIPWDDDIDLAMPRSDYDRLISLGNKIFEYPYFLQSVETDEIKRGHIEIRKNDTTCFMTCDYNVPYKLGIFIDVFALDYINPDNQKEFIDNLKKEYSAIIEPPTQRMGTRHPYISKIYNQFIFPIKNSLYKNCKLSKIRVSQYEKYVGHCKMYSDRSSFMTWVEFAGSFYKDYYPPLLPVEIFEKTVFLEFEGRILPCPVGYHEFLTILYGDYMKPSKAPGNHSELFFDAKNGYNTYVNKFKSYKEFLTLFTE